MKEEIEYTPLTKEELHDIKVGDTIERMLGFTIPLLLVVQSVSDTIIDCGWIFDRNTGLEIDEDISVTVSYIRKVIKSKK
jgi:hypothetical protein